MTFADWQEAATPERQEGRVCFDREARTALLSCIKRLGEVTKNRQLLDNDDELDELESRIAELDAQVEESTKTFTFERIPRRRWRELEEAHPATDAQRKEDPRQTLDPDTFGPAVAAACCVDPGMTLEEAQWLQDFLPDGEWEREVLGPVMAANQTGAEVPKGAAGIAGKLITELRSISRQSAESPSRSSGDE